MNAGNTDVVEAVDRIAHDLRGHGRLFRDVQVGRAGAGDDDRPVAAGTSPCASVIARAVGVIADGWRHRAQASKRLRLRARDEQRPSARDDSSGNCGNLRRCLPKPEYDFGKSLRSSRCVSTRAKPRSSNGAARIAAQIRVHGGSRSQTVPARTASSSSCSSKLVMATFGSAQLSNVR